MHNIKNNNKKSNYKISIPSRENIINFIKSKALSKKQLFNLLNITDDQKAPLSKRLNAMVKDKQLNYNKKGLYRIFSNRGLLTGIVIANQKGFGFVSLDNEEKDLKLSYKEMQKVFHGDKVKVRILNKKLDAEIVKVIEPRKNIVARIVKKNNKMYAIADDKLINNEIELLEKLNQYKNNQIVVIEILSYPDNNSIAKAKIIHVIGDFLADGVEIESAIYRHNIAINFSPATLKQSKNIADKVLPEELKNRVDMTHLPFITIDGKDSRDFDDAVFAKKMQNSWKLYVAIADVAHYVAQGSPLDKDAVKRGNSVYFPNKVIPMLPEKLSNNICSLNPKVKRLAMVCEMDVDNKGNLLNYNFSEAVIFSNARLNYDDLNEMLLDKSSNLRKKYAKVMRNIDSLYDLYKILRKASKERGVIDFDMSDNKINFTTSGKIKNIVSYKREDSHKIIEECMLLANQASAKFLTKNKESFLYRVHPEPVVEKIQETVNFLSKLEIKMPDKKVFDSQYFANILQSVKHNSKEIIVRNAILRTMKQAFYSCDNQGHFGLVLAEYTHFTSPIRRYPDLLTHRAIKRLIHKQKNKKAYKELQTLGQHLSSTERTAEEAVKDVEQWLKCEYMLGKLGSEVKGVISGITHFGIFIELTDFLVTGFIPVADLHCDYYVYDKDNQVLVGRASGKKFNIGDSINTIVSKVNLEDRKINLALVN